MGYRKLLFFGTTFCLVILVISGLIIKKKYQGRKPNILLITACSLRKDHLGCYGYQRNTSFNLDAFAKISTVYENCYTHTPWTSASTVALLTGSYPYADIKIENKVLLPEILQENGYRTIGIIGTNMVRDAAKTNKGFDVFLDNYNLITYKDKHSVKADVIADEAIDVLNKNQGNNEPLFLWLFFKDPHWPYLPPYPFNERFLKDDLYQRENKELPINSDINDAFQGIGMARLRDDKGNFITNKAFYISQYDSEICFMDYQIGRVLQFIKEKSSLDKWLIIFTADHGESLGEDEFFFQHAYTLSQPAINIPLIIKFPEQIKRKIEKKINSISDICHIIVNEVSGKRENWLSYFRSKDVIIFENDPGQNRRNEKFIGGSNGKYKLIWNLKNNKQNLYDVSRGETLLTFFDVTSKRIGNKIIKILYNFFYNKTMLQSNTEALKSLGYFQ